MEHYYHKLYYLIATEANTIQENLKAELISNRWVQWVIIILVILIIAAYAFYCTSKGYNFGWGISFSKGNSIQMGVKCLR